MKPVTPLVAAVITALAVTISSVPLGAAETSLARAGGYELNDSHFHLTNYVQEGTDIRRFLEIMGDKVGRVALFGSPLQQMWSYENSGDFAPT